MILAPLVAMLVGALFAVSVAGAYRARRRPYQAAWAVALALFAVASAFEVAGQAAGWNGFTYRGYYLFGGILNVGWLAVGTLLLLAGWGGVGRGAVLVMAAISLVALAAVLASTTDPALLRAEVPGRGALRGPAVALAPITNVAGSGILIGGAAWSAWRSLRRGAPPSRVLGTALIAAGAFVVAAGHSLAQVRGVYVIQPAAEAIGIGVMFAGYLAVETERSRRPRLAGA